jgi:hypothetical protein
MPLKNSDRDHPFAFSLALTSGFWASLTLPRPRADYNYYIASFELLSGRYSEHDISQLDLRHN